LARQKSKLYHHLKKWLEKAVGDYDMIREGDRVLVGVSGGADSLALMALLDSPMVFTPPFEVMAVHIDLGFPGGDETPGPWRPISGRQATPWVMDTTRLWAPGPQFGQHGKKPLFLCSRLRRRRIFEIAHERGVQQDRLCPPSG
jgi:tRNA 2-thiocytidine biosynthesis protein TtcA